MMILKQEAQLPQRDRATRCVSINSYYVSRCISELERFHTAKWPSEMSIAYINQHTKFEVHIASPIPKM